jgi:hypothetical protein
MEHMAVLVAPVSLVKILLRGEDLHSVADPWINAHLPVVARSSAGATQLSGSLPSSWGNTMTSLATV